MAGAVRLSGLLRPRGVPLPRILGSDVDAGFPWLVLERLLGTDLGAVISKLSHPQLEKIAQEVARAQSIASRTPSAGRYGYASIPEQTPCNRWSEVLFTGLERSRQRIVSAGLFDVALVDALYSSVTACQDELDKISPTPFLHDTTTKNVIVSHDGQLSGIVDVDDLCFGDPRYPAALTLAVILSYGGPVEYVTAWLRHAGMRDDRVLRLYVSAFVLGLMSEHGHAFNGNEESSSPDMRLSLMHTLQTNLVCHP